MLFCRFGFLALLLVVGVSCGESSDDQQESVVTTTYANLFPENLSTTTLPTLEIPGWEPRELPELEQFMLHKIFELNDKYKKYFRNYDFHNDPSPHINIRL